MENREAEGRALEERLAAAAAGPVERREVADRWPLSWMAGRLSSQVLRLMVLQAAAALRKRER